MTRVELINSLARRFDYKTYLEIGVGDGTTYEQIDIENKECCDPNVDDEDGCYKNVTYEMTSDKMWHSIDNDKKWDIIFIDGLHEGNTVLRDLFYGMYHLSDDGVIIIHDSLPISEESASYPRNTDGSWHGTVYKIYPVLNAIGIKYCIINDDQGMGVVPKQQTPLIIPQESILDYNDIFGNDGSFIYNLNIISPQVFEMMYDYFSQ